MENIVGSWFFLAFSVIIAFFVVLASFALLVQFNLTTKLVSSLKKSQTTATTSITLRQFRIMSSCTIAIIILRTIGFLLFRIYLNSLPNEVAIHNDYPLVLETILYRYPMVVWFCAWLFALFQIRSNLKTLGVWVTAKE